MSFPETVKRMKETGVERYYADLVALQKTHYSASGEVVTERILLDEPPAIAQQFSAAGVQAAIKDIQQSRIQYADFLRRIMAAGVTDYMVYIDGKKAIYNSRDGDFHIERFPSSR
jgi:uncharacterized protein YbcV (DUF1398 family)